MVPENMCCIVFPKSICDFKEPECSLSRVDIYTCDDLHNIISLYDGPCICQNSNSVEFYCTAELGLRKCPLVILPENIKMEPICKLAADHRKLLMNVSIWTLDVYEKLIPLYSGRSYIKYSDDCNNSVLEDSSSVLVESNYTESESDLLPELNSPELNTMEISSLDFDNIDLPSFIEQSPIDPYISNILIENGNEFTNTDLQDELIDTSSYPNLYNDADKHDYLYMLLNEETSSVSTVSYGEQDLTHDVKSYEKDTFYFSVESVSNEEIKCGNESQINADMITYEEDETVFEEMMVEEDSSNENRPDVKEMFEDEAMKQLMSSNIQSSSKQRKVIIFSGKDSQHGQTIQKISYNDPNYECPADVEVNNEVVIEETATQKKYQCAKCNKMFSQLITFKEHMTDHGPQRYTTRNANSRTTTEVQFSCKQCGKKLKSKDKFEVHCLGHGDPERECSICHNVFASKFSLRTHMKTHNRKHRCKYCTKTFDKEKTLKTHTLKMHPTNNTEMDLPEPLFDEVITGDYVLAENGVINKIEVESDDWNIEKDIEENIISKRADAKKETQCKKKAVGKRNSADANDIITKAVSHEMFLSNGRKHSKGRKQCNVCPKSFDRISDLKRHLIEHTLTSTLRKNPVNNNGTLDIQCCLCDESFSKIDKYKAHLREHANLTTYTCTFCDKCFSDSSNFSKHKKIHGFTSFQCDVCQRKFNSKKMLVQHMEYHNENPPITCKICDKVFYFDSMLKKHIKSAHTKESCNRFRCRFCRQYYKTLKEKWDHEWLVHSVRKMIVDCLVCGAKFRKYSELKRHCYDEHDMEIPLAKHIIKETKTKKRQVRLAYE